MQSKRDARRQRRQASLQSLLRYLDAQDGKVLGGALLGCRVALSRFHLHREFARRFGIGVLRFQQLRRLERAAYILAFRLQHDVLHVALASGYRGPEAFARAFRRHTGQSPAQFRRQPRWRECAEAFGELTRVRRSYMTPQFSADNVRIVQFEPTPVAVLEHRGDPRLLGDSIRKFIAWRKQQRLSPQRSATFNLLYADPQAVAPEAFRIDLCVERHEVMPLPESGLYAAVIPGGRCAVMRHRGGDATLGAALRYLRVDWFASSGERLRDYPLFVQRVEFYPDVAEQDAVSDLYLPLL